MPTPERPLPPSVKYLPDADVLFAVEVAIAAKRPILLRGPPGCGKTSLAAYVAALKGFNYYRFTVTSRTSANDLCWSYDAVGRLAAAQAGESIHNEGFITPGPIWRAFEAPHSSVVLVDEIDKADPDVPNDLLEVFGEDQFTVDETGRQVRRNQELTVLMVLTTNEERELSRAFLRRCVVVYLPLPTAEQLVEIAIVQLGEGIRVRAAGLATSFVAKRSRPDGRIVSTAEFVDALRAGMALAEDMWHIVERVALWKESEEPAR